MSRLPIRVVKVGGSLLRFEQLPRALNRWLADQPAEPHVLVAGGGPLADCIRDIDQTHAIGESFAHELCVHLLETTGRLVEHWVDGARLITRFDELQQELAESAPRRALVFSVEDFLQRHEDHVPGVPLAHSWRTSADSIAARVAVALQARELVLLKSCDPPALDNLQTVADGTLVDLRSVSRVGVSDLGANAARIEDFLNRFPTAG